MPLTSPYGPGVFWTDVQIGMEWAPLGATLRYVLKGRKPGVDLYSTPYLSSDAIEAADRQWSHEISVTLGYQLAGYLALAVTPAVKVRDGSAEVTLEVSGDLRKRFAASVGE